MSAFFKAILVTGARQVGKTTMLRHLAATRSRTYVTLDNLMARHLAKTDPVLFFKPTSRPFLLTRYSTPRSCTLADTAEVSQPTAKEWLRLLEGMGIVRLLRPYANNALKRLTKAPKLYFLDTGLAAHLSMWLTRDTLMNGAACGHYFENFVVVELLKNYAYSQSKANMTYYRDSNAKEIDIIVERNNLIHPLEIKKAANPDSREVRKFSIFSNASIDQGCGGIVCMCEEVMPIDSKNCFIPCNLI
jgi:predicted AAA+ superfamily ATPase